MKKERRKSMQGTVLFTTVSVMALLIIFLMGTLVLSSASNTRAHKSYSTSQASYTARAAIDAFLEAASRDSGIQSAITSLGAPGTAAGRIEADMIISDKSLGEVGYVDPSTGDWTPNKIIIESIDGDVYEYLNDNNEVNGSGAEWKKLSKIKVSASVRVGKEVETVTALIKKRTGTPAVPPTTKTVTLSPSIKGIQSLGNGYWPAGAHINGGLGISLSATDDPQKILNISRNQQEVETPLTFINGSISAASSSISIIVHKPNTSTVHDDETNTDKTVAPSTPFSATVITGNMYFDNNKLGKVDYKAESDDLVDYDSWTSKDIPYIYVDGAAAAASAGLTMENANSAPFNFYFGTLQGKINFQSGNIYLMDPKPGNEPYDKDSQESQYNLYMNNHPETYTVERKQEHYDPGAMSVRRGLNYLKLDDYTALKAFADSFVNKTTANVNMHGGSIFCNGDLFLDAANHTIEGDIRVEGDLYLCYNPKNGPNNTYVTYQDDLGGEYSLNGSSGLYQGTVNVDGNVIVGGKIFTEFHDKNNYNDVKRAELKVGKDVKAGSVDNAANIKDASGNAKAVADLGTGGSTTPNVNDITVTPIENKIVDESLDQSQLVKVDPRNENLRMYYFEWVPSMHPMKEYDNNQVVSSTKYVNPWGEELTLSDESGEDGVPTEATRPIYYRWQDSFSSDMFPSNWENDWVNEVQGLGDFNACLNNEHFIQMRTYLDGTPIVTRPDNAYDQSHDYYYGVPKAVVADDGTVHYAATAKEADPNETYQYYPPTKSIMTSADVANFTTGVRRRFDINNNPTLDDAGDHEYTYYYDADTWDYDENIAKQKGAEKASGGGIAANVSEIYPKNMTREAIFGTYGFDSEDGQYKFMKATSNPIVTTLDEARAALGLTNVGLVDTSVYNSVDDSTKYDSLEAFAAYYKDQNVIDMNSYSKPCFINNKFNPEVVETLEINNNKFPAITKSCTITGSIAGDNGSTFSGDYAWLNNGNETYKKRQLLIKANENNTINIVLRNYKPSEFNLVKYGKGTVNILLDGTVNFSNHSSLVDFDYFNTKGFPFDYTTDWGINWYGAQGSKLTVGNNCTLMGSFKLPYTDFEGSVEGAEVDVKYTDEFGQLLIPGGGNGNNTYPGSTTKINYPIIVGNALFGTVYSQNTFTNFYTASGATGNGGTTGATQTIVIDPGTPGSDGYWDVMYMSGS